MKKLNSKDHQRIVSLLILLLLNKTGEAKAFLDGWKGSYAVKLYIGARKRLNREIDNFVDGVKTSKKETEKEKELKRLIKARAIGFGTSI